MFLSDHMQSAVSILKGLWDIHECYNILWVCKFGGRALIERTYLNPMYNKIQNNK